MSMIGVPGLAMLLVLANIAFCLSAAPERDISDVGRQTSTVLSPAPPDARPRNNADR